MKIFSGKAEAVRDVVTCSRLNKFLQGEVVLLSLWVQTLKLFLLTALPEKWRKIGGVHLETKQGKAKQKPANKVLKNNGII